MAWLKEEGFGGIMVWSIDMDDFRGTCGSGKFPLLNAMRSELEDYKVKLEYDGPFESYNPNGQYTTKDREYLFILRLEAPSFETHATSQTADQLIAVWL